MGRLMIALILVSAAVGFLNVLNIAALTLFRGDDFLAPFEKPQRDAWLICSSVCITRENS
jgi:hypothetical protein